MKNVFAVFDRVRIVNLLERVDRRREMAEQLDRIGGSAPHVTFFDARRPASKGEFESLGARGCFESHLSVLRSAYEDKVASLLLLEDDFDFTRDGLERAWDILPQLSKSSWDIFYGAHILPPKDRSGLAQISPDEAVITASCVAFSGNVIPYIVDFLDAMARRPAGSPDFGPMHVDGAYTTFRLLYPHFVTCGAFPPLGRQRSSRSDITPTHMILDRWSGTRGLADRMRRTRNRWLRK